jgi:hypothetical protein
VKRRAFPSPVPAQEALDLSCYPNSPSVRHRIPNAARPPSHPLPSTSRNNLRSTHFQRATRKDTATETFAMTTTPQLFQSVKSPPTAQGSHSTIRHASLELEWIMRPPHLRAYHHLPFRRARALRRVVAGDKSGPRYRRACASLAASLAAGVAGGPTDRSCNTGGGVPASRADFAAAGCTPSMVSAESPSRHAESSAPI